MSSVDLSWNICVERFVHSGSTCICGSSKLFMMSLYMLIFEMRIKNLGVGKHTEDLVIRFSSVDKFMAGLGLNSTAESDGKPEDKMLWNCFRSHSRKVIRCEFYIITKKT